MFDSIRHDRPANRARQTGALLLSISLNCGVLMALGLADGQTVVEVPGVAHAHEVTMVELAAAGSPALPPGPPRPAPAASGDDQPQAPEPNPQPTSDPPIDDASQQAPPPPAVTDGAGSGTGGGGPEGSGGTGDCTGEHCDEAGGGGGGGGGGGNLLLQIDQVKPLTMPHPRFPTAARRLGLDHVRCVADVRIDTRGRPTQVDVDGCDPVFAGAVQVAMMRWRFEPARVDGQPVPARFRQRFKFVLR